MLIIFNFCERWNTSFSSILISWLLVALLQQLPAVNIQLVQNNLKKEKKKKTHRIQLKFCDTFSFSFKKQVFQTKFFLQNILATKRRILFSGLKIFPEKFLNFSINWRFWTFLITSIFPPENRELSSN